MTQDCDSAQFFGREFDVDGERNQQTISFKLTLSLPQARRMQRNVDEGLSIQEASRMCIAQTVAMRESEVRRADVEQLGDLLRNIQAKMDQGVVVQPVDPDANPGEFVADDDD